MFSRGFGGFVNFTLVIGNLLPNHALYQAEPHPEIFSLNIISQRSGFVKSFFEISEPETHKKFTEVEL